MMCQEYLNIVTLIASKTNASHSSDMMLLYNCVMLNENICLSVTERTKNAITRADVEQDSGLSGKAI